MTFTALTVAAGSAENWPAWRGPTGNAIAPAGDYAATFSSSKNIAWKVKLPGKGSSTPAVWGDRIFITVPIAGKDGVICLDRSGKESWQQTFSDERAGKHANGSGSNPSPVTDGNFVFTYFKSGTLAALEAEGGKKVWEKNLQTEYGADTLWWDLGTSPVLVGDLIVVAVMQEGDSFVVAFDKKSGKEVWKTDRTYEVKKETGQSYTTPLVVGQPGEEELVVFGADRMTSHRAKDGKLVWECGGYNPEDKPMWRVIASPAIADGVVVVPYGRKGFFAGVKLGGKGDVTQENRLWTKEVGADVPSPIAHKGRAYLVTDRGHVHCFDIKTGDELWDQKLPRESASYYASPALIGDDFMVLPREDGVVMTLKLGKDGFELLGQNDMGERVIGSPVPVDGMLLLRGNKHLFAIKK